MGKVEESQQNELKIGAPMGEVVLGKIDPRTLTEEEFRNSPELLFHGAAQDFSYSHEFDYSQHLGPHSSTVGNGFYTTPRRSDAELFVKAFSNSSSPGAVLEVLPYQAKMYDFREANNMQANAFVPKSLFTEYYAYINQLFLEKYAESKGFDFSAVMRRNYLVVLEVMQRQEKIELREMLSASGNSQHSEFAANYFTDFMKQKGFDGVIYIEGGDHPEHQNPISYVFYNAKKIGTYQSWKLLNS